VLHLLCWVSDTTEYGTCIVVSYARCDMGAELLLSAHVNAVDSVATRTDRTAVILNIV